MDVSVPITCQHCNGEVIITEASLEQREAITCDCGQPLCGNKGSDWLLNKLIAVFSEFRALEQALEKLTNLNLKDGMGACEICQAAKELGHVSQEKLLTLCNGCEEHAISS